MSITNLLNDKKTPLVSFEFFPPSHEKAASKLETVIDKLMQIQPDFVSVVFKSGGLEREGSYKLAKDLKKYGSEVLAYVATFGLGPDDIMSILNDYKKIGVENILCVRGDKPRDIEGFKPHPQSFAHASDFLAFVKERYDFCVGAAGYPEGHVEAPSLDKDIEYVKLKVNNGASFIVVQYSPLFQSLNILLPVLLSQYLVVSLDICQRMPRRSHS